MQHSWFSLHALLFYMAANVTAAEEFTCSGMEETVEELRAELSELRDNCTVINMNSTLPCKILIMYTSGNMLAENCILECVDGLHIIVEGVRWTKFWWYTPVDGWPTAETDVLGGLS